MLLLLVAAELSCELDSRFPDRNTEGKTLQLLADEGGSDMWEMLKLYPNYGEESTKCRGGLGIHKDLMIEGGAMMRHNTTLLK